MRKRALLLLLVEMALPAFADKRVTVEQLEQVLSAARGRPDAKVAQQLSNLELTERLSAAGLSRWQQLLPGPESRRSLVVLADVSAFLDPPAAEIPATPTPDLATQRKIMALAVDYATKTIHLLPNFLATRDTIRFEDTPAWQRIDAAAIAYQPLHAVGRFRDTVLYRDGQEIRDSEATKEMKSEAPTRGLTTRGEFGPILGTVLVDGAQSTLAWSHWENSAYGPVAVFRYAIPMKKSHYQVEFCCVSGDGGNGVFRQYSGYHGKITVDPVDGTIRRLTVQADLELAEKIVRADILVEYGPVEIGGRTYICPLKSVSISRALTLASGMMDLHEFVHNPAALEETRKSALQTLLNDVVFEQYHVFRSDARVLTEDNTEQAANSFAPESSTAGRSDLSASIEKPGEPPSEDNHPSAPTAENSASASPATTAVPTPTIAPEPAVPEISMADTAGIPDIQQAPTMIPQETGVTFRVTARLVEVGVAASDKKGHPVTDLKPQDLEVYDNGRKQALRFFSHAVVTSPEASVRAPEQPGPATDEVAYSNRNEDIAATKPDSRATGSSVTVLLIDAGNLAWADLTWAREQVLKFLQKLPPGERVGLYARSAQSFEILAETTTDHTLLASKLREWMPSAQSVARAQEEEQRNRQQFDEVLHQQDLQYVNGNMNPPGMTTTMLDPQLRDFGSNPGRDAMTILVGVARHLAAIPGHKNLVWVASDNVLANWADISVGTDNGSKHVEGFILRAQEALNDAQVSIYPLDASQSENMAVDPSLRNSNVELSPSVTLPPGVAQHQGGCAGPGLGRTAAEMQQNMHPIQVAIQQLAEATGGRVVRRTGNIEAALNGVIEDGRGTYLLGFTPDIPADDQYHRLTVKLAGRSGVVLRYRTGYLFSKDLASLNDRFLQAIWQPLDVNEIEVSVRPAASYSGATLNLRISTKDLALTQQDDRWVDKLAIFVVLRTQDGLQVRIRGRKLNLALLPATYQSFLEKGIPFDQFVEKCQDVGSVRIVVVDENSGRVGTVSLPGAILRGRPCSGFAWNSIGV